MSECSCANCTSACSHKPGWFLPEQIAPLAKHLGLTEQQLFDQHLLVDWVDMVEEDGADNDGRAFVLSPAIVNYPSGTNCPANPRGVCHWFIDGKCAIHSVKPFECASYDHTKTMEESQNIHRHIVPKAWLAHQDRITELLGEEPEANDTEDGFSFISGLLSNFSLIATPPPVHKPFELSDVLTDLNYDEVMNKVNEICKGGYFVYEIEPVFISWSGGSPVYKATFKGHPFSNEWQHTEEFDYVVEVNETVRARLFEDVKACISSV